MNDCQVLGCGVEGGAHGDRRVTGKPGGTELGSILAGEAKHEPTQVIKVYRAKYKCRNKCVWSWGAGVGRAEYTHAAIVMLYYSFAIGHHGEGLYK